jgi:L,D-transpeptidase ErfK/SrfK
MEAYSYDNKTTIIGKISYHKVKENESLIEIARNYGLGYNEIVDANPSLDPFLPGTDNTVITPTLWILPDVDSHEGIVINISEMRLFFFFKQNGRSLVRTFPIGIGDEGTDTPIGVFKITQKTANPSWHVPASIRKERPELPAVVPPGPENPLGSHALRLSNTSYLLHGTNRPFAVGRRVTHGCIRLYPEDTSKLFDIVPVGTKVQIIRQPVKAGVKNGKVYIEVHRDESSKNINLLNEAVRVLGRKDLLRLINTEKLYQTVKEASGIPTDITDYKDDSRFDAGVI